MNEALYRRVLEQIKEHPETWVQGAWHSRCGTKHCFAGWVETFLKDEYEWYVTQYGPNLHKLFITTHLDIPTNATYWLVGPERTIKEFELYLNNLDYRRQVDRGILPSTI